MGENNMGYGRFSKKEEEIMESFLKHGSIPAKDIEKDYPEQVKSLKRRWFIKKVKNKYIITSRGTNAIIQQIRTGRYWVAPLSSYKAFLKAKKESKT